MQPRVNTHVSHFRHQLIKPKGVYESYGWLASLVSFPCHSFAFLSSSSRSGEELVMTKHLNNEGSVTSDYRFLWAWSDRTLKRSNSHQLASQTGSRSLTDLVSVPLAAQRQEVRLISNRQWTTVKYISKDDHILKHWCMYTHHMTGLGLCAVCMIMKCDLWPKKCLHCFLLCAAPLNELIVSLSAERKHTRQIPHYDRNLSHFPQSVFSSKSQTENKGPYSVLAIGILSAALQHRCLEIMMHTGTHLDNSRINQKEAPGKLLW